MLAVVPLAEPAVFLRKQQLIHDGKPVVAAVLLFSDEPQAVLPKRSSIKVYRYGTTGEGTRDTLAFNPITVRVTSTAKSANQFGRLKSLFRKSRSWVNRGWRPSSIRKSLFTKSSLTRYCIATTV